MLYKSCYSILLLSFLFNHAVLGQERPSIQWSEKYGTSKSDIFHAVLQNQEGAIIAVGEMSVKNKDTDIVFAKIQPSNGLILEPLQYLGRTKKDAAYQIIETREGGYAIAGYSQTPKGMNQAVLIRLDVAGKQIGWTNFGQTGSSVFYDIVQNNQGDFFVVGKVGDKACLVKYNAQGKEALSILFDLPKNAVALTLKLTASENLVVAIHYQKSRNHFTQVAQFDSEGQPVWKQDFPNLKITDLIIEANGHITATGTHYMPKKTKKEDLFLLKLNAKGEPLGDLQIVKQDKGKDGAAAIVHSRTGYYYTAGYNSSFDSNINFPKLWVHKMDEQGKSVLPNYLIEGSKLSDSATDIIELKDGSLLIAGQSESTAADGKKGAWLLKLLPEGYVPPIVSINEPKTPIVITWVNDAGLQKKVKTYLAYQPLEMKIRAIAKAAALRGVDFAFSVNKSAAQPLITTKEKSNRVPIGKKARDMDELNFESIYPNLKEGINTISITANDNEVGSFSIDYRPSMPNLHLISIGIPDPDLEYTTKDADDFANLFQDNAAATSFFNRIKIDRLLTDNTTKQGDIQLKIENLRKKEVKETDYILLFISSHGFLYNNDFYIPASDYEEGRINALNFTRDILHPLATLECKKIIFIDACHSGKGAKSDDRINSPAEALERVIKSANDFYIITSSSAKQKSYENKAWENGAFTQALTEAFTNQAVEVAEGISFQADDNKDDYLTLAEVYVFLRQRVPFLTASKRSPQYPNSNKMQTELGLPIFKTKR